jgi:hypothetical protein
LAAASAPLQDENLLVVVPDHFQIGNQRAQGPTIIAEYVPEGETVSDWSRMVTIQVFRNMKKFDPDRFADGLKRRWGAACAGSEVVKSKDGQENGYPFSLWVFTCPLNPATGKPENMFAKFISGDDALYSIQYAYRSALTKEKVAPAVTYLSSVRVCDSRLADRPCPKTTP